MDVIYLLSPQPHIVECLLADLERRRYRRSFLVWTGVLDPQLRRRIDSSPHAKQQLAGFETLTIDFFPRESHLITFRDPWSFPILYHPSCNHLVREHMQTLAQRITGICVSLGEYPKVRYYKPRAPTHEASVLCGHLARFVQEELDDYAQWNPNFPPPTSRPQGVLIITDRSMDLMAPLLHEFTYQAMAHDLLNLKEGDKVTFHMKINEGTKDEEDKDMELHDKDKVWVDNRHKHMRETIDKLREDFRNFISQNPNFTKEEQETTNLNNIKDMLAGLPQFQEQKESYSLHLTMAQEAMNVFARHKLPDVASVEQTLAMGVDEDFKKPKNILEQVVRLLDDEAISHSDRLRLIMTYALYRGGFIQEDVRRLLAHASLPPADGEVIQNLELLGGHTIKALKEPRNPPTPVFPLDKRASVVDEENALSRFEPTMKRLLDDLGRGALDQSVFPYVKPPMDPNEDAAAAQGSLRTAAPRWAGAGRRVVENRQRIIVFVAGGATYSESRACYEISGSKGKDVFLATSHMLTPSLFLRQVRDLSVDKRRLDLPQERPKPKPPAHLFERPAPPPSMAPPPGAGGLPGQQRKPLAGGGGGGIPPGPRPPPTAAMGNMNLGPANGGTSASSKPPMPAPAPTPAAGGGAPHKLEKDKKDKKKKKFLGIKM
ncbi:Sec1-like protein [Coniochaeta sp. 2T2.1]|nr:Sec1-like protein [Coniochaeta sp. 2T2.1]